MAQDQPGQRNGDRRQEHGDDEQDDGIVGASLTLHVMGHGRQAGFVERTRSTRDQRALEVSLTPRGVELRQDALTVPEQMLAGLRMSVDELTRANALLREIIVAAEASVAAAGADGA